MDQTNPPSLGRTVRAGLAPAAGFMLLAGCITPPPEPLPTEGERTATSLRSVEINSCANPVVIRARSTAEGIAAQEEWVQTRFPNAVTVAQSVSQCGRTPVDRVTFRHQGVDRTVLFDVSSYFGQVGPDNLDDLLDG